MKSTDIFLQEVRAVWGNPKKVAQTALNELFRHRDDVGLDADDQVQYALDIGVLAAEMKEKTPEEFIAVFERQILV